MGCNYFSWQLNSYRHHFLTYWI